MRNFRGNKVWSRGYRFTGNVAQTLLFQSSTQQSFPSSTKPITVTMSTITSEKATEYLNRVNWKSLVEWLTAEAILNRPVDPLQYCRDLLGSKLAERGGLDFRPEQTTDWLRNCYTEATSLVDENGVIHGKSLEVSQKSLPEQLDDMHRQVDAMQKLLDASKTIANLDPMQVCWTLSETNSQRIRISGYFNVSHGRCDHFVLCRYL